MTLLTFREAYKRLKYTIYTDDIRNYGGRIGWRFRLGNARSRLLLLLRISNFLSANQAMNLFKIPFKLLRRFCIAQYNKAQSQFLIEISHSMIIGDGLFLPHPNGIIINSNVVIGKNCTILQHVTIGNNINKGKDNLAKIGDNVSIGAGAKIIGPCKIGNNVMIGANAVVVKDVPDNSVVGGVPAVYISSNVPPPHNGHYLGYSEFESRYL